MTTETLAILPPKGEVLEAGGECHAERGRDVVEREARVAAGRVAAGISCHEVQHMRPVGHRCRSIDLRDGRLVQQERVVAGQLREHVGEARAGRIETRLQARDRRGVRSIVPKMLGSLVMPSSAAAVVEEARVDLWGKRIRGDVDRKGRGRRQRGIAVVGDLHRQR